MSPVTMVRASMAGSFTVSCNLSHRPVVLLHKHNAERIISLEKTRQRLQAGEPQRRYYLPPGQKERGIGSNLSERICY